MITIHGLTKHYGDVVAVDNASFTVSPGTITGFLGPNGAGKSTTLRLILGLEQPTSGEALIDGQPYRSLRRRQHMARLNEQSTQVAPDEVATERDAILALWQAVFGAAQG